MEEILGPLAPKVVKWVQLVDLLSPPGVRTMVAESNNEHHQCSILIIPLFTGRGGNGKLIEADGHHYFTIQSKRGSKASLRCKVKECSVRGVLNMESDMITLKVRFDRFSYR